MIGQLLIICFAMPKNFITYFLTMILLGINAMYMLTQRCILFLKCSRSQDYNGTFNVHINSLSKRKNLTGWILRTFISRDKLAMLTLFKALVFSRLDYGSQL